MKAQRGTLFVPAGVWLWETFGHKVIEQILSKTNYTPPQFATRLLQYLPIGTEAREAVEGDLEEEYHAIYNQASRGKLTPGTAAKSSPASGLSSSPERAIWSSRCADA